MMPLFTRVILGGEQRSLQRRQVPAENRKNWFIQCQSSPSIPTGAHQNRSVKVSWHQLNILTLNTWLQRNRSEANFGILMPSMKISPLCTYMQQQCPTLTTRANTELCQHMTQKRRRRRWKNRPKKGKTAGRKANKKQQSKQLCSEWRVCNSEIC